MSNILQDIEEEGMEYLQAVRVEEKVAQGDGILREAPVDAGVLEKVRSQDSVLHHSETGYIQVQEERDRVVDVVHRNGLDEVLLPPLPDINQGIRTVFGSPDSSIGTGKSLGFDSTKDMLINAAHLAKPVAVHESSFDEVQPGCALAADSLVTDPNNSFDLSKALEIPNHDHTNSGNSNILPSLESEIFSNVPSQNSISSLVTTPIANLKRKISNTFNATSNTNVDTTVVISPVLAQQQDFSLCKITSKSSTTKSRSNSISGGRTSRSSSNAAHTVLLPVLNMPLEKSVELSSCTHIQDTSRRSTRKFSVESHNSSSLSILNGLNNNNCNNSSNSNTGSSGNTGESTVNYSSNNSSVTNVIGANGHITASTSSNTSTIMGEGLSKSQSWIPESRKSSSGTFLGQCNELPVDLSSFTYQSVNKTPLLERASSIILRKTSLRKGDMARTVSVPSSPHLGNFQAFRSLHELPYLQNSSSRSLRVKKKELSKDLLISKGFGGVDSKDNISISTDLSRVSSTKSSRFVPFQQPSFGSKVRRGFSRILSGGHSRRTLSQRESDLPHLLPKISSASPDSIYRKFHFPRRALTADFPILSDLGRYEHELSCDDINTHRPKNMIRSNNGEPFRSVSTGGNIRRNNNLMRIQNTQSSVMPEVLQRENSIASTRQTIPPVDSDDVELIFDVEEITGRLPTITITEDFGARHTTPLQTQSNIWHDIAFKPSVDKTTNNGIPESTKNTNKVKLKDYIYTLTNQQMIEDERFVALERAFIDSGWCSQDDFMNLRQKRIAINNKWAERISYYKNKLKA